ncbi:carboxyl transferase domain-containing protein [Dietzia sp.]|uniref:carboxyl transferase domain-containing protein n=1 Tax=Dietzia sp. TaxID=1871616 RepID=UPI002FDB576E
MARSTPRLSAIELLDLVLDPGSFDSWDSPAIPPAWTHEIPGYQEELAAAKEKSGVDESVITGSGTVHGRRVCVIVGEFAFLAGSIGVASASRVTEAVQRATAERLPILAAPTSGGTRMQEGTVAFVQMVKIAAAVAAHKAAGLPYLVYLRHPTTGGVFASWASLGHVTVAEPGALVGFLGPRVYEALYGEAFPEGVQRSENLAAKGVIDGVVRPDKARDRTHRALRVLCMDPPTPDEEAPHAVTPREQDASDTGPQAAISEEAADAWRSVVATRRADRPGTRTFLSTAVSDMVPLSGTGQGEDSGPLSLCLARIRGQAAVIVGQDRQIERDQPMGPSTLRTARRGMRLSRELGVPLVLLIDTRGADLSKDAEEGGLAGEIARSLADLVSLPSPTISVILGQGTGGGALALLPADRVICAQNGWLSPLPPEGASAIVHRHTEHAAEMARSQHVSSTELLHHGIADVIVPEKPDAADEPVEFCHRLADAIADGLRYARITPQAIRVSDRLRRYRMLE